MSLVALFQTALTGAGNGMTPRAATFTMFTTIITSERGGSG